MNTKRVLLSISLAAILALLGPLGPLGSSALAASDSLVGSWTVTVTPEGEPSFVHAVIFCNDGTVTAMEPDGRLGIGVWENVSKNYGYVIPKIQGGQVTWTRVWENASNKSYAVPKVQGGQVTWSMVGDTTSDYGYAFTFWEFNQDGGSLYRAKMSGTIQLNEDGEHYTGRISVETYDLYGNLLATGRGTANGVRQHIEAMH